MGGGGGGRRRGRRNEGKGGRGKWRRGCGGVRKGLTFFIIKMSTNFFSFWCFISQLQVDPRL